MAKEDKASSHEGRRRRPDITIRAPRPSDFVDIVDYYFRFYDEVRENPVFGVVLSSNKPSMNDELRWFSNLYDSVARGDLIAFVAEVKGRAVGLCEVRTAGRPGSEVSHRGDLGIAVSSDYRGMGVGTALLRSALRNCKGKFEIIELSVFSKNLGARRLYERFGFRRYATRPASVKRGTEYLDEELMRLDLRVARAR